MSTVDARSEHAPELLIRRISVLVEAAHDALIELTLDADIDADLSCTLAAVDLRDALDQLHREAPAPDRLSAAPLPRAPRDRANPFAAVGACLQDALRLVADGVAAVDDLSDAELLALARVAHGLSRVFDRLKLPRP